jgi:general secretion pathway protein M
VIAAWWKGLSMREQRIVAVGGVAAAVLLGWALVWHPLAAKRSELLESVDAQRRDLAYVRVAAAEVERLRATGVRSRADRQGRSLLALADATARSAGLESALKRVEPVGATSVRVSFEFAGFDPLIAWTESLSRDYGIETTDFSADRADGVGLVNARVTLQDAP